MAGQCVEITQSDRRFFNEYKDLISNLKFKEIKLFDKNENIINYDENTEKLEFEFAKYLIDKGASIENNNLGNLIFIASRANNLMMVEYLIESMNVDMNMQDKECKNTPIMWAVKFDCYNVVKYLIDNNANLEILNNEKKLAMDIALEENNEDIIKLLIK